MPATTWYTGVYDSRYTGTSNTYFIRTAVPSTMTSTSTIDWQATTSTATIDTMAWTVTVTDGTVTRVQQQEDNVVSCELWTDGNWVPMRREMEAQAAQFAREMDQEQRRRRPMAPEREAAAQRIAALEAHAAREQAWERGRERVQQQQRKERRANRRALALLLTALSVEQRVTFRKHGWFYAIGGHTGMPYRIKQGIVANVEVLHQNRVIHRLCGHPEIVCPVYDVMVAQLMHLQDARGEQEFLAKANRHEVLRSNEALAA